MVEYPKTVSKYCFTDNACSGHVLGDIYRESTYVSESFDKSWKINEPYILSIVSLVRHISLVDPETSLWWRKVSCPIT